MENLENLAGALGFSWDLMSSPEPAKAPTSMTSSCPQSHKPSDTPAICLRSPPKDTNYFPKGLLVRFKKKNTLSKTMQNHLHMFPAGLIVLLFKEDLLQVFGDASDSPSETGQKGRAQRRRVAGLRFGQGQEHRRQHLGQRGAGPAASRTCLRPG